MFIFTIDVESIASVASKYATKNMINYKKRTLDILRGDGSNCTGAGGLKAGTMIPRYQ